MSGMKLRGLLGRRKAADASVTPAPAVRETQSFADGNNDFALAMYRQLRTSPGNLFFSPFSIRTALGMVLAGARGETAVQMRKALRIASPDEALHAAFGEAVQELNAVSGEDSEMAVANSLWGQEGVPLLPDFLELCSRHYGGVLNVVDFRNGAETARVMNQWVEDRTRQKIRNIIPPGSVDATTRMVLLNAVYFNGKWAQPFREDSTQDAPFYLEGGGEVQAPLMYQRGGMRYLQASRFQAVELSYRAGNVSMLVFLPNRRDGLRDLEEALTPSLLRDTVEEMVTQEIDLVLPRFKIAPQGVEVGGPLDTLGMSLAFDSSRADFSGVNGREPAEDGSWFLSHICHKALVETNEVGTEAAASTALWMVLSISGRPPVVRADHPFLFAIRDSKSGAILFLGRVADPTRES